MRLELFQPTYHLFRTVETIHLQGAMNADSLKGVAEQLLLLRIPFRGSSNKHDSIPRAEPERPFSPSSEQDIERLLYVGAPHGERLTGRPIGAYGNQPVLTYPSIDQLGDRVIHQLLLAADRNAAQIGGPADISGMNVVQIEQSAVVRHVIIGVPHQAAQLSVLVGSELGLGGVRMPIDRPGRSEELGAAHPIAPWSTLGCSSMGDDPSPSIVRARVGVASVRPKVSASRETRSIRPAFVASSLRSKPK